MLCKRRRLRVGNKTFSTPLLLPSFSSKGFPKVAETLSALEEYLADELLISAYDIYYKHVEHNLDFADLVFLDSGGYEASKEHELSETFDREHRPAKWTLENYEQVIANWTCKSPTVFVSFDLPSLRDQFSVQIERAKNLPTPAGDTAKALLLKPESDRAKRLHLANALPLVPDMRDFAIIGVTEKEIGNNILNRMTNIARLRSELDRCGIEIPIHVFGSLDTLSTYLYFLSGADIFDGLTWLRYAFFEGDTIYRHSFGFHKLPITTNADVVEGMCWSNNLQYMQEMKLNMKNFLIDKDYHHFGKYSEQIKRAHQCVEAELTGG